MARSEWRGKLVDAIVARAKVDEDRFSMAGATRALECLADEDATKQKKDKLWAAWFLKTSSPMAVTRLLNEVKDQWQHIQPEQSSISEINPQQTHNHSAECVIALKLKMKTDSMTPVAITEWLSTRIKALDFTVLRVMDLTDNWVDVHIAYSTVLADIYELLYRHPMVKYAVTKPSTDLGKITPACKLYA
jgi:hypothetical protein